LHGKLAMPPLLDAGASEREGGRAAGRIKESATAC
jgi:hypothetical protein